MRERIWELCVVSVLSGVLMSLTPEGSVKRVMKLVSGLVLLGVMLRGLVGMDLTNSTLDFARYRRIEQQLLIDGAKLRDELDRRVVEEEYAAYVRQRASAMGIELGEVSIGVHWHTDGVWVPASASITLYREEDRERLSGVLSTELGIPEQRQKWVIENGLETMVQTP